MPLWNWRPQPIEILRLRISIWQILLLCGIHLHFSRLIIIYLLFPCVVSLMKNLFLVINVPTTTILYINGRPTHEISGITSNQLFVGVPDIDDDGWKVFNYLLRTALVFLGEEDIVVEFSDDVVDRIQ